MTTPKKLIALALVLGLTGCQSYFRVDVSIFNGSITEFRQADDASQAAGYYAKAYDKIGQYAAATGLDDGSISTRLPLAISQANAAVSAGAKSGAAAPETPNPSTNVPTATTNTPTTPSAPSPSSPGDIQENYNRAMNDSNSLSQRLKFQSSIASDVARWPTPAVRRSVTNDLARNARAMKQAAEALTHQFQGASSPSLMVLQERFSEAQNRFSQAETTARATFNQCSNVITDITKFTGDHLAPDKLELLRQKKSEFAADTTAADGAQQALTMLQPLAAMVDQAITAGNDAEAAFRLVNYDATMDLSDPNWRYLAEAPPENWRSFQHIQTEADGSANYVIIQEGMGDFRLKKLFNDPTDGYKAGVQIGQKVLQTVASAALAASTGGAGAALLPAAKAAAPTTPAVAGAATPAAPAVDPTAALSTSTLQTQAALAALNTNRAFVKAQLQLILTDLPNHTPTSATPLSSDYLLSVSNKLDTLKGLLQTGN